MTDTLDDRNTNDQDSPHENPAPESDPNPAPENANDAPRATEPPAPEPDADKPKDDEPNAFEKAKHWAGKAARATGRAAQSFFQWLWPVMKNSDSRAGVKFLDKLLDGARAWFPPETILAIFQGIARLGHISLALAQILTPILFLIAAIKFSSGALLLQGIGWTVLLMVLHYTADRFLDAGEKLVETTPSAMASPSFLNCMALLAEALGIIAFFAIVIAAGRIQQWNMALIGLAVLALGDAVFFLALHPSLLNIRMSGAMSAGEEAVGILSFFAKTLVRMIPVAFGIGTLAGAIGMLMGIGGLIFSRVETLSALPLLPGTAPLKMVALCAALPLAGYVLLAFYHLLLDLFQAILGARTPPHESE